MKRAATIAGMAMALLFALAPGAATAIQVAPSQVALDVADLATDLQVVARQQKFKGGKGNANRNRGNANRQNANRQNANRNNNRQSGKNFNNNNNRNRNVNRNVNVRVTARPVRGWVRRPYYGTIVGGVALGTIIAASTVPVAPASGLCWYWTDATQSNGYWDYCN